MSLNAFFLGLQLINNTGSTYCGNLVLGGGAEAPVSSEFLSLLRISEFFGFQWQKLAEILSLFKLYNNLGKVAVRVKLWLIIYCGHLVEWIVK